jgi:hypothetical protein
MVSNYENELKLLRNLPAKSSLKMDQNAGYPLTNLSGFAPYFNNSMNDEESVQCDSGDLSHRGEFGLAPSFNNSSSICVSMWSPRATVAATKDFGFNAATSGYLY